MSMRARQRARRLLATNRSSNPLTKRQRRAARKLLSHHTAGQVPQLAEKMNTAPWYCQTCYKKNSYKAEFCDKCGASWNWPPQSSSASSWDGQPWSQDRPQTPRRRSSSRARGKGRGQGGKSQVKGKGKAKQTDGDYSAQSGLSPWQQSSALQTLGVAAPDMMQKITPTAPTKQVEGVISGLRAHLKTLGQESCPEVEAYLAKCLGNGPQVIKQASQRLEASGKTAARLKVELAQLKASWQKFQKQVEEEYEQQKTKFMDKRKQLLDGLAKAEEEYSQAQEALREAAVSGEKLPVETPVPVKTPPNPNFESKMDGTPTKRSSEVLDLEDDQAEYVAQLMRFDVETGRHNEAFDHCMWDDTMTSLSYLDLIERSFRLAPELHGIPWSHIERQVEGSSFWTLMGLEQEDEYPGCVEWTGSIPQGDRLITLSLEDEKRLMESLEKDSLWAFDFLSKQHSLQEKGIEIVTYGHFDQYQGQRTTNIPLHLLKRWKDLVRQQWEDFGHFGPFDYHLVHPHPPDSQFAIHVIVRCRDNPGQQHFLLVDQIDESPLDRNYRSVIAVSHVPNGYEVMLATANDLNTISSRTILKHGTDIWPLHQRLPVRDGQYWRILHENHEETISFIQSAVELDELPRTISSEGSSLCSHVIDRWCGKGNDLRDPSTTDATGLMQQSLHLQIDNSEALAPSTGIDLGFEIPVNAWSNFCEVCFLSPEEGSWTLMTHGLWEQHLGSRPVEVDEADPQTIKVALRAAWNDVPHPAQLHAVHPNPEDGPFAHIIIEFKTPGPYDDSFVPVLRRIFRNDQVQCEAAYHQPARQAYDIYYQAGLDTTCKPWNHHECRVYVNKVQLRDTLPFTLQPGSLVDIHVEPLPLPGHHVDRALSPDEGSSFCSHVSDRWCSIRDELQDGVETDEAGLMQHPLPSQSDGPIIHDFFHLENEHFHLDISNEDVPNLETIVENDRQLPSIGPNSIRGFHWVANPPRLGRVAPAVYILELRGDAESRLMNDDVLCLCQLTIEQPGPQGDLSTKIRVLWTPHIASRERIMFHLRAADLCREMTCILYVNHIVWNVQDSIIRHFNDGDFIHLRIVVAPGESVAATRCDFQSYESTERHRRVFTNGSRSSQGTETPDATPSDHSIRSRSRGRRSSEPDAEPDLPPPSSPDSPEEAEEEQDEADDQLSLLQLASYPARHTLDTSTLGCTMDFEIQPDLMSAAHSDTVISIQNRRQLDLSELLPATSVISCDLTEVHNAKQLLSQLPWLLSDIGTLAIPSTVLEAMIPVMKPWNFEVPVKYQLYTDGSYYKRKPEVGGCGIVLVVETEYGPLCGGLMSRTCLPTARSHSAEAIAMLWASIIAVQLNELHQRYFPAVAFKLDFCYDAEVTGKQSAGQWTSFRHSGIQQLTRNMIYVLQHRSGPQALDWIHIPAHQGHWWNEVADALAKNAVTHSEVVQNSDLLYSILDAPALMKAFGWIWAYEAMIEQHPSMPCIFDNYMLRHSMFLRLGPTVTINLVRDDYRIVWSTYNVLAVRLLHPALRCIVIAARAPTSDKSTMELQAFWSDITKQVLQKFPGWKILLLCDSNSHVGSCPSTSISDCGEELENQAGAIFHGWLLANDIWLPSTWQHVQKGDHYTYVTPSGSHHHRLDFVGLSLNWPLEFVATEVNFDIDGSLSRYDHFAATCTMKTATSIASKSGAQQGRKPSLDRAAVMKQLQADPHYFDSLPMIPWSTDVHRHATGLATATLGRLWSTVPCTRRHVRKRQLTDLTWNILMWKRRLRKHHLDASRRRKFGTLREILLAWKGVCASTTSRNVYPSFRWLKFIDVKIALMEHNLHKVQPLLQTMIKQDDIAYYKALALRAGRTETEDGMQALWKELRGTLPKWKTRRTQPRHDIDEALCLHFSSLEAGTITSFNGLYRQCVDYQNQTRHSAPQTLNLDDLPSLFEIEQVCRRTTPTRAPGPDTVTPEVCRHGAAGIASHVHNMVFKICCEQAEPIWFKGGYVHPIYKQKGALDDPAAYRGVVLLDVYGKKFHAWLRQRLVPVLQHRKTAGQLGGLPCEQTLTGSHLLRVHGQVARALRISSAVVFVDVRAAFHHMLRELIFLQGSPALHPEQALDAEHFNMQELQELLLQRCCEHPDDFPAPLRKLADDVHRHTWFTQRGTALQPTEVVHTLRGTRPGSPVADVGFNLLMSDILTDLQQRLDNDETLQAHNADFPVNIPPITWVDDLAIPIHASHPSTLSVVIQAVLQHVHEVFYARGLQINYDKGKTEVVVMFRGSEADEARRQFFSTERETYIVTSTTTHVISVRAALTIPTRIQLLHSLVFSKLLYGSGGWYEIPRRTVAKLDSILMRFFRSIVNEGFWKDTLVTDDALRAKYNLPTFRYLLAVSRLRFLRHVATHTHSYHRQLLLAERITGKGWLFELEDDLDWMRRCIDLPELPPTPTTADTWQSFLLWLHDAAIPWKTWIKRATKMHFLRENIAYECRSFHQQAQRILETHGGTVHTPTPDDGAGSNFACPECHAVFATSTGVAVHRAKKHGVHSPLRDYVQSATCPGCLRFMWTTSRVVQHLRYRPNRCFDRIFASCTPRGHVSEDLPEHLRRVKRLPASRYKHGPLLPLPHEKERVLLRERLQECEARGTRLDYGSPVNPAIQKMANVKFKKAVDEWLHNEPDHEEGIYVRIPHPKKQRRAHPVQMQYGDMEQDEMVRHGMVITMKPSIQSSSWRSSLPAATFYVVHLYSGRRRVEDLQWHLEKLLKNYQGHVQVLSVDTAVHHMCDVNAEANWKRFWDLADSGYLVAMVLGPPCETWSAARNEAILDDRGCEVSGPRPLRSASRPWGIDSLAPREYRQLQVGMRLLLRGLLLATLTVINGGSALLEHPAESTKEGRPSIWKTGIMKLLAAAGLYSKHTFAQFRFGSPGVKPTTFLYGGMPRLPQVMRRYENHQIPKPSTPLIGRTAAGTFHTSAAKEYPGPLCEAIAACIVDQLSDSTSSHDVAAPERLSPHMDEFLNLLHMACSNIDEGRSFLPDYQGR
eukprot:symbB.v1.2.003065.t1/scaffold124.1/size443775/5